MKYALLIHPDPTASQADVAAAPTVESWFAFVEARGAHVLSARLDDAEQGVSVRQRDGRLLVTEGPFAETGEQLAGVAIIECASLEEAVEIAARNPQAHTGRLEVRAVHSSTLPD